MVADSATEVHDGPDTVETMNKLMNAVDRLRKERDVLRGERDTLQRDFDFLKAESKFTIDSLRKQGRSDASLPLCSAPEASSISPHHNLRRAFNVSILVAQHLQAQQSLDSVHFDRLSLALSQSQNQLAASQQQLNEKDASVRKTQREDAMMRDALTTVEVKLASAETRVADLTSLVRRLEEEAEQERASHEEMGVSLAQTEAQLSDVSKALEDTESQRASLALQVSHLQQDLDSAKAELLDAEARYSTLQAQQLASMSTSAQNRALKEQIVELEGRVMRRTEQIGIHQHDIKRLETNLRLQEERVVEMTAELEVAEAEKKAMVEDCSNTREERDAALKKCEQLEEDIEMVDESRESEVQTLVGVIVKAIADRRVAEGQLTHFKATQDILSQKLHETAQTKTSITEQVQKIEADHRTTVTLLEEARVQLQSSQESLQEASGEAQQATVALATLYQDLHGASIALHDVEDSRSSIERQFQAVRTEMQAKLNELSALRVQYEALRSRDSERSVELESSQNAHNTRVTELEEKCRELQHTQEDLNAKYEQALHDLEAAREEVRAHVSDIAERTQAENTLKGHLEETQRKFEVEAVILREQLATAKGELEQARLRQASAESEHRQALEDADSARKELQLSLTEAVEKLEMRVKVAGDLEVMHAKYEEEAEVLKERLRGAERELEELRKARDENVAEHARALVDLDQKREEAERILGEKEAVDVELAAAKLQLQSEVKALEDRIESMEHEQEEAKRKYDDLEVRNDQVNHEREELEEQLRKANTDVDLLRLELKAEMEGRSQQAEELANAKSKSQEAESSCVELRQELAELQVKLDEAQATLQAAKEQGDNAVQLQEKVGALQVSLSQTELALQNAQEEANKAGEAYSNLKEQVVVLQTKLEQADAATTTLQEEEQRLHMELTPLQAEVQKLLSERRFLESKIQSSESDVDALKKQLEDTRIVQVQWEKTAKSAEVKLDLQVAQHNKAVDSLRKELAALEDTARLADTVADLEEKNLEMDVLLKAKCQEIEENDDRFIKFLKDEKKLNAKVEFLTKKVKSLQDKLAAVSSQDSTPKAVPLSAASASQAGPSRSTPPAAMSHPPPPTRPIPTLPEMPDFSAAPSSSRSRSSSTRANPISPEDRIPLPVFRPRTPEHRAMPTFSSQSQPPAPLQDPFPMSASSSSTIGIKRRAPDDFDDCDNVPPQPFTTESVPHGDGVNTPRIRRALQAARSGFTPVRHVRPAPSQGSPSRRATTGTAIIADVTNSPRSKSGQSTKRGWLGKIKGGSSSRTSSRPIDNRPQNAAS